MYKLIRIVEKIKFYRFSKKYFANTDTFYTFAHPNKKGLNGPVVQLVRMPPCHGGGRGFESRPVRQFKM
jgi:hypothetical protein